MSITELLPILQKLSHGEKHSILEFLKADLNQGSSSSASSDSIYPHLHCKDDILVIETIPLSHIDFNQLIDQSRENPNFIQM